MNIFFQPRASFQTDHLMIYAPPPHLPLCLTSDKITALLSLSPSLNILAKYKNMPA